ncbi:MAG TPA: shikimate dehydrogenase [Actinobacteria bacterium]|jgi:shikimate dehydrogenase|nr:shikimate dehydrogenase [Actinomycetota bacterium]
MGESALCVDAGRHRAAVLGSPVAHSLSPALHRAAYASLGLDWTYTAIDVDEAGLAGFLAGLDDSWAGLSLTMPLKEVVIGLLDHVDDEARLLRSVNTVVPVGSGWGGVNTDVFGITESLVRAGLTAAPDTATVLGAGATARSAVAALARMGTPSVLICARRHEAAGEVAALAVTLGLSPQVADLEPAAHRIDRDVVISTLPGDAASAWAAVVGEARGVLLDASYHPWPTALASAWGGCGVASGRDMLLWQAVEQVRLMTGREPSAAAMSAALPE